MSKNDSGENQHNRYNGQYVSFAPVQSYGTLPGNLGINNQTISNIPMQHQQYNTRNHIYQIQPRATFQYAAYPNQPPQQQQQQHRPQNQPQVVAPTMLPENIMHYNPAASQYMQFNQSMQLHPSAQNPIISQPPRHQQTQHQFSPQYQNYLYHHAHQQQVTQNQQLYQFNQMQQSHPPQNMGYTQATQINQPIQLTSQSKPPIDLHPTSHITQHPQSQMQQNVYPQQPVQPQSAFPLKTPPNTMMNNSIHKNNINNDLTNNIPPPVNITTHDNKSNVKHVLDVINPETHMKVNLSSFRAENHPIKPANETANPTTNGDLNPQLNKTPNKINQNQSLVISEPSLVLKETVKSEKNRLIIQDEDNDNDTEDNDSEKCNDDASNKSDIIENNIEIIVPVELIQDQDTDNHDLNDNSGIKEETCDNDVQSNETHSKDVFDMSSNLIFNQALKEDVETSQNIPMSTLVPTKTNSNASRFIYSRDTLLRLSKLPNSITKPDGLANIEILKGVISETPQDSTAVLEISIYKQSRTPSRPQNYSQNWRHNSSKTNQQSNLQHHSQQKYIQIDRSDLMPLSQSEDGYLTAKKRKEKGEEVNEIEELTRQIKGVLNKIVPQNFNQCLNDLVSLKIETHDGMKCLVNELFLKAVKEEAYSVTFAKICKCLDSIKADVSENEIMKFRSVLLHKCQTMFTTPLKEQLENVRQDWLSKADKEKPKTKALMISDVEEQVKKAKDRYYGNIRFIGELYLQNILITRIINFCIDSLTTEDPESLICLCKLLETCGAKLETDTKGCEKLKETCKKLSDWSEDSSIEKRVRFRLMDILEMRKQNWSLRHIQKAQKVEPKTLNEIKLDSERQSQLQQQQLANAQNENRDVYYNSLNRKATNTVGWSADRRMSVPANSINSPNNSMHSMNTRNPRMNQHDNNFNLKDLSVSKTMTMNDENSFVPLQSRPWNKGSGYKVNVKHDSTDYTNNEQKSFNESKFPRQNYQKNNKSIINQSLPTPQIAKPSAPSNSIISVATSSPSSSRSSSNSRKPSSISSSSLSQQDSANKQTDSSLPPQSKHQLESSSSPGASSSTSTLPANLASVKTAVTKQLIKDDLLTCSNLLELYLEKNSFCDKSWCSYSDKVNVVYEWLDTHIEVSLDVRTRISSLLFGLINRNVLEPKELLDALQRLSGFLEDLQIDAGNRIWNYFNDFLIEFGNDSLLNGPSLVLLNKVFDISDSIYSKEESYIEYNTLPWCLLNSIKLSSDNLGKLSQLPLTKLLVRHLEKAVDSLLKLSFHSTTDNVDVDNCLYMKWLSRCVAESVSEATKTLFIVTNWSFMFKKIRQFNESISENEYQSIDPIRYGCRCLSKITENNEHFKALTSSIESTNLSQKSILNILWFLYRLNDTSSDCDLLYIINYWKEHLSIESHQSLQTTNQINSFSEFCELLTNQISSNNCNIDLLNSTSPHHLTPDLSQLNSNNLMNN